MSKKTNLVGRKVVAVRKISGEELLCYPAKGDAYKLPQDVMVLELEGGVVVALRNAWLGQEPEGTPV